MSEAKKDCSQTHTHPYLGEKSKLTFSLFPAAGLKTTILDKQ